MPNLNVQEENYAKKLTITIDEEICEGLYRKVYNRKISGFIETLVRQYVLGEA